MLVPYKQQQAGTRKALGEEALANPKTRWGGGARSETERVDGWGVQLPTPTTTPT